MCSEEKIEFAGALGKADVSNRMLDDIERDLEELYAAAQLDSFCLYVYGLVLADRYVMACQLACTTVLFVPTGSVNHMHVSLLPNRDSFRAPMSLPCTATPGCR